jgi:hypothetical protein
MLPPGGEPSGASARNDNGAAFAAFREHRFLWRRIEKRRPHGRRPLHQGKPPIGKLFRAFTVRAGPSRLTVNPSFLRAGRSACVLRGRIRRPGSLLTRRDGLFQRGLRDLSCQI